MRCIVYSTIDDLKKLVEFFDKSDDEDGSSEEEDGETVSGDVSGDEEDESDEYTSKLEEEQLA